MKRILSWIVMVPFAVVVIVFSAVNRDLVRLDLWPFPLEISIPIFTLVLAVFIVGFVWGGAVAWLSAGDVRKRARNNQWRAESAERELRQLNKKLQERAASVGDTQGSSSIKLPAKTGTDA